MRRAALPALVAALALLALGLGGGAAPFGRVALALGLPRVAALLFTDPQWRGVALYRAGRFDAAAQSLAAAPVLAAYNRGNALARAGHHAAALEAWDMALAQDPGDGPARANFDLVAAFYAGTEIDADAPISWHVDREGPTVAAPLGQGNGRAASTGDTAVNTGSSIGLPELISRGQLGVRQNFDGKVVVASARWLATLRDEPGAYLAARIAEESKRRAALGLGQPAPEVPW